MNRLGSVAASRICLGLIAAIASTAAIPSSARAESALSIGPTSTANELELSGPDTRQQVFVTQTGEDGKPRDVTRSVTYSIEPEGIAEVTADGLLSPIGEGTATLIATIEGGNATEVPVRVTDFTNERSINFKNQIVPIFTKHGCNSGGCHGKSGGQNGFRLSLLGFYPEDDYEFLVKEGRGRRLFPPAPEESLLLKKGIGEMPHGGGARIEPDSHEYRLLVRWISQGMPYGSPDDPVVTKIECLPATRVMNREAEQQVTVRATYSDGRTEDVTQMALFEANDPELAEATKTGLVHTTSLSGEVAVMARYQGQVATFRATVPLGAEVTGLPEVRNFVDEAVFEKLKTLGIPPSPVCDDATFLRRVSIDITGTLPRPRRSRRFSRIPLRTSGTG